MRTKVGFPPLARSYLLENGDKFSDLCHLYLSFPYIQSNMNHNSGLKRRVPVAPWFCDLLWETPNVNHAFGCFSEPSFSELSNTELRTRE